MERQDFIDQISSELDSIAEKLAEVIEANDEVRTKLSDLELNLDALDATLSNFIEEED